MRPLVVLLGLAFVASGEKVLSDLSRGTVRQKSVLLSRESFTTANLLRLGRAELGARRTTFTQVIFYGDGAGAPLPKPSHITYDHWRELYESQANFPNEIAEMIAIGKNAVLRVHEATGRVSRNVIAGKDPLQLESGHDNIELLYFGFTTQSSYIAQRVDVYARTAAPLTAERGVELLRSMETVFPYWEVSLFVQRDPWFVSEPSYPFFNPFVPRLNLPTPEEYQATKTLRCGHLSGSASCVIQ